ncbi:hypothetical protein ACQR1I_11700 [Bradyrhizobium sp. HKCCYLS2038]|uniref:hypothetical protein n=1 Tax=unclassified Bradyrhizobium TaxID=2631580 RepID=UPI003EB8F7B7
MDDAAEYDIKLEEVQLEIDDLRDRIHFYQRQKEGFQLIRERGVDPKEDEYLRLKEKDADESILTDSIKLARLEAIANDLGQQLRQAVSLNPEDDTLAQKPEKPKIKKKLRR